MRGTVVSVLMISLLMAACGNQAELGAPARTDSGKEASLAAENGGSLTAKDASDGEATWRAEVEAWANAVAQDEGVGLVAERTEIFFGDFNNDNAPDALLFAEANGPTYITVISALFRNENGHMQFVRRVEDVFGSEPQNAQFTHGQVTLTTTFMDGPDAGQSRNWTIQVAP